MSEVLVKKENNEIEIKFIGRLDSGNASDAEHRIFEAIGEATGLPAVIDASELEYVSSAGLRVILHLRKTNPDLKIVNANSEVYEILDMTGFTQMIHVEKAYREISIEGCEVIGQGANGTIYRIDQDNVVKVYNNKDALQEIQNEREVARKALILGIPTALSYDVVKVGDHYGSVFELLNARSFAKILADEPERMDWCVDEYIKMLNTIHSTRVPKGELPNIKDKAVTWVHGLKGEIPQDYYEKLNRMFLEIPDDDHMIHGDYHTKNIELVGDEVLIIDMDTLSVGNPIFELAQMFNSFLGFSEYNHDVVLSFQGFDRRVAEEFWHKSLVKYLGTEDEKIIANVENMCKIIGYSRIINWNKVHRDVNDLEVKRELDFLKEILLKTLDITDSLVFQRNELTISATKDNLEDVIEFIESRLKEAGASPKSIMQISVAVEEIFVNIANYAYTPGIGDAKIRINILKSEKLANITFIDRGVPYNPLNKEDPDTSLSAEEREIGGLGIYMVKNSMDDVKYEYLDGQNILTITKSLV